MEGGWKRGEAASLHRVATFHMSLRGALGRRCIKSYAVNHKDVEGILADAEIRMGAVVDFDIRHEFIVSHAFAAHRRILPRLATGTVGGHYVADRCLVYNAPDWAYIHHGVTIEDPHLVLQALAHEWSPIFSERRPEDEDFNRLTHFAPRGAGRSTLLHGRAVIGGR